MKPSPRLTIVVDNYNYANFLDDSIGAALAVRWPNKEVFVVDDGSIDDSRRVIERYSDRVRPFFKENGGLNSAANLVYPHTTGDVVMFCDADDMLFPSVAEAVFAHWHEGVSKVQFGLDHVDSRGQRTGHVWPALTEAHTPEWARRTVERAGYYAAPPTTGNAWSRSFLEQLFPLPTKQKGEPGRWGMWFDDYLNTLAPFFGEVISLTAPQAAYRVHDRNADGGVGFTAEHIAGICEEETLRTRAVNRVLSTRAGAPEVDVELFNDHMKHRLIYRRLLPEQYASMYDEAALLLFAKYCRAIARSETPAASKAVNIAWGALMATVPKRVAFLVARAKWERLSAAELLRNLWTAAAPLLMAHGVL